MERRGRGEGTIYRGADGRWEAKVDLEVIIGRQALKSVHGHTRREIQEKLTTLLANVQRGLPVLDERTTVGEFLTQCLSAIRTRLRPKTFRSYEQIVR